MASDSTVGDAGSDSNADAAASLAIENTIVDGYQIVNPSVAVQESDSTLKSRPSIAELKAQLHVFLGSHVKILQKDPLVSGVIINCEIEFHEKHEMSWQRPVAERLKLGEN